MIGENIKRFRHKRCMTQEHLAELLNVKKGAVSMWELNKRTPDVYMCAKIAEKLQISLDELINGKQEEIKSLQDMQQKNCIEMIMQLDEELLSKAEIYLTGLSARTETFILKKIK